jgi:hypothetical protein
MHAADRDEPGHGPRWILECPRAWAGAPAGAIPNDLVVISMDRRACPRRSGAVQGETGPAHRDCVPRDQRRAGVMMRELRHPFSHSLAHITPELTCGRVK